MKQALGLVEIKGLSTAVVVADAMSKAANVQLLGLETAKGMGYMTIKVVGDVGAVNAAVSAGCQVGTMNQKLVSWKVIPRPSDDIERMFCTPVTQEEKAADEPQPSPVEQEDIAATEEETAGGPAPEIPVVTEEAPAAAEEVPAAVEAAAPVMEEAAPAVEEAAPAVEEAAPAVEEAAPAVEETPVVTEEAVQPEEAKAAPKEQSKKNSGRKKSKSKRSKNGDTNAT